MVAKWGMGVLLLFCHTLLAAETVGGAPANLLTGGDFETPDATGWAQGWFRVPGGDVQLAEDAGNHFARLKVAQPGSAVMQREIARQPDWKALKLSLRVRYAGVRAGKKGWNDARVQLMFLDDKHKTIGQPAILDWTGSSPQWKQQEQTAVVPPDAVKVKIQVLLLDVAAGQLDIDDVQLIAIDPAAVSAKEPAKKAGSEKAATPAKAGETPAPLPVPTTQPLPYKALDSQFKGITIEDKHVGGWYILNGSPEVLQEGEHAFLRLKASDDVRTVQVRRLVSLNPDWGKLTLAVRVRHQNVKHGEKNWQNARIIAEFLDDHDKRLGSAPAAMDWKGTSKGGWIEDSQEYVIPLGAAKLKLDPALLEVASGTLDLESLTVTITQGRSDMAKTEILPEAWRPAMTPHWREQTATRQRICLNGVWQIRPFGLATGDPKTVTAGVIQNPPLPSAMPAGMDWGYGKVPSTFPGSKESCQDWALPQVWTALSWASVDAAWFRRPIEIPADWAGKRILLDLDTIQSQAAVFVGDKLIGRAAFPAGSIDLTEALTPGQSSTLTLLVIAKPYDEQQVHAMNPGELYLASSDLKQRGLCGDIYLRAEPRSTRLADVQLRPSVRKGELAVHAAAADAAGKSIRLRITANFADATEKEWTSPALAIAADGSFDCAMPWKAQHLWDLDAPNLYDFKLALLDDSGTVVDEVRQRMGFREMWLDGRDIILNGTPIHWRVTKIGANFAGRSKSQIAGTFRRMRELGFNCMILDYDFNPGSAPTYVPMLEAADEAGIVMVFTIPSNIPWKSDAPPDPEARKRWEERAGYCINLVRNHPSVLAYSTNHNRLGYNGASNPLKLDGLHDPKSSDPAFQERRKLAAEAEAWVRSKDPTREIYHHSGGNFGTWETNNTYLNWMPIQERADYLSHWAQVGVKPVFLTEYGMPFVASWGRYRGPGVYRSTTASEPLFIEYSAALTGARAYEMNALHEQYVDSYEAAYQKNGKAGWGELTNLWMRRSTEWNFVEIQALHALKTFPAMRTFGISAILPWDYKSVATWTDKTPKSVTVTEPAENWTFPGLRPDQAMGYGYSFDETWFDSAAADTYRMTVLAQAYRKVNADVLAWIAGEPEHFTSQAHVYEAGQQVRKQLIVINDLRHELKAPFQVDIRIGDRVIKTLTGQSIAAAGAQQRQPIEFAIPADAQGPGKIHLALTLPGGTQSEDDFAFTVLPPMSKPTAPAGIALWDPKGLTDRSLKAIGLSLPAITAAPSVDVQCLLVGREALTGSGAVPDIRPLLDRGGTVVVFEQTESVLTDRLGFRTATPSLRQVFARTPSHPLLNGITDQLLCDWNGDATLIPPALTGLPEFEAKYPSVDWLGFRNTRVWKAGNWGQLASVVIEKPQSGDFLPLLDGGFDLQYTPLLLAKARNGRILFCQLDLSGRSAADPVASRFLANIVDWAAKPPTTPTSTTAYIGDAPTRTFLESLGAELAPADLPSAGSQPNQTWIIGPGATRQQLETTILPAISKSHGTFLFLFQSADALKAFGDRLKVTPAKLVGDSIPAGASPAIATTGIGPAELHLRARTALLAIQPTAGWHSTGGALAHMKSGDADLLFLQIDPRTFDYSKDARPYVKLTHNRTLTLLSRTLANAGVTMRSPLADFWDRSAQGGEIDLTKASWQAMVDPTNRFTPTTIADAPWQSVVVPGPIEPQRPEWATINGTFWYRVTFDVPASVLSQSLQLTIGTVDDEDWTFLNGTQIGHIGKDTNPQDHYRATRQYKIPAGLLHATGNTLLIRGNNIAGVSGILEDPVRLAPAGQRWRQSYYHDTPVASDDPYRYYRW